MQISKRIKSKMVCLISAVFLLLSTGYAAEPTGDALLEAVPEKSLFCVRLNNFDYTLGQFDQFIAGISPVPMGVSMLARMQLAGVLGDPALQGLDTTGSFAIFGVSTAKDGSPAKPEDMLVTALLPVKGYEQFVSACANVNEPDANGVSRIVSPQMGTKSSFAISVKAGEFALLGDEKNYDHVLSLAKSISENKGCSIAKSLDAEQAKLAKEMPLWAYGDIERINNVFRPAIEDGFKKLQENMQQAMAMTGQPQMGNPTEAIKIYMDLAKALLEQGKFASLAIKPEPSVLRITKTLAAKPDTEMAKLFTADATLPKENKLLGYLESGSAINVATKFDRASMKKMTELGLSFMKAMPDGGTSEEEMNKWQEIIKDSIDATGNMLAMSMKVDPNTKPPFAMKYLVEIKDIEKYKQTQDESCQMMQAGAIADAYKKMGMSFEVEKDIAQYKGVSIDSGKLQFKATDVNSPEAQVLQMMYGDGFTYRMAYVNEYFTTVMGGDMDTDMKALIDQVKAGPREPAGEVKTAMDLLPNAKTADFFATLNIIRLMQLGVSFAPIPIPISFEKIATNSNIAFAGKGYDGKIVVEVAIPKEHLAELAALVMMMQPTKTAPGNPGKCSN